MVLMQNELVLWLTKSIEDKGWSLRELARRSGVSHTTISLVLTQQRLPTWDFCAQVAQVFDMPPEQVFRMAGLLPPLSEDKEKEEELLGHFYELDNNGKKEAIAVIQALKEARESRYDC
jgi:transcriptional regulator with XRE-family HTH domain